MHDTAYLIGGLVLNTYCDLAIAKVLEAGSFEENGSLRSHALPSTEYTGVDTQNGGRVDVLMGIGEPYSFDDETFDLIMMSSVFECDTHFWFTFMEMCRMAKAGGHVYVSAPATGTVRRSSDDKWHLHPDAGLALACWSQAHGQSIELIESFVVERQDAMKNDFFAVWRKGPSAHPMNTSFVHLETACRDVHTWQSAAEDVFSEAGASDDFTHHEQRITELEHELAKTEQAHAGNTQQITELENELARTEQAHAENKQRLHELENLLEEASKEATRRDRQLGSAKLQAQELLVAREQLGEKLTLSSQERDLLRNRIVDLENNLRQRQEEIEQSWHEVNKTIEERDRLRTQLEEKEVTERKLQDRLEEREASERKLQGRLSDTHDWLLKLSGERRATEARFFKVTRLLEEEKRHRTLADAATVRSEELLAVAKSEFSTLADAHEQANGRLEKRHRDISSLLEQLQIREGQTLASEGRLAWLSRVDEVLSSMNGWRNCMPPQWRRKWQLRTLRHVGLFDSEAYLDRYPDVAQFGMDPLQHYILHGMMEGRTAGEVAGDPAPFQ